MCVCVCVCVLKIVFCCAVCVIVRVCTVRGQGAAGLRWCRRRVSTTSITCSLLYNVLCLLYKMCTACVLLCCVCHFVCVCERSGRGGVEVVQPTSITCCIYTYIYIYIMPAV